MAIYTLTTNLIENIKTSDIELFGSLLGVFTNVMSGHKIAIDCNKKLLALYSDVQIEEPIIKDQYSYWLDLLSYMYDKICEYIDIDITSEDNNTAFLKLSSAINGTKKIIVYSRNGNCPYLCNTKNETIYNGISILVLNKTDAVSELNNKIIINNEIMTTGDNSPVIFGDENNVKTKIIQNSKQ